MLTHKIVISVISLIQIFLLIIIRGLVKRITIVVSYLNVLFCMAKEIDNLATSRRLLVAGPQIIFCAINIADNVSKLARLYLLSATTPR